MKRPSKSEREEVRKQMEDMMVQIIQQVLLPEGMSPKQERLIRKAFRIVQKVDGSQSAIKNATSAKLLEAKELLKSAPYVLRQMMTKGGKRLPFPSGGRTSIISKEERPRIIKQIMSLIADGYDVRQAKEIAAKKRGVSVSTIHRVWKQRTSLN